jgi:hypothetical protein
VLRKRKDRRAEIAFTIEASQRDFAPDPIDDGSLYVNDVHGPHLYLRQQFLPRMRLNAYHHANLLKGGS